MSDRDQEIISRLRRAYEAFSRGDFDKAITIAHPEIEFVSPGVRGRTEARTRELGRHTLDDDGLVTRIESSSPIRKAKPSKPQGFRSR